MKKLVLGLLLLPVMAFATITAEQEFGLNRLSGTAQKYGLGTAVAKTTNMVVGKFDFAVQGGASLTSLLRDLKDLNSTVVIPSRAVIKQVWTDTLTVPAGGSLGFRAQTTGDLVAVKTSSTFSGEQSGVPTGTAATMIKITADRTLKAETSALALTAGKINVYVEYVLGD